MGILDSSSINVIGEDFGAYISLLLIANVNLINKLLLVSPIINPHRHVHGDNFIKVIQYITHFLPGNIRGIENLEEFVDQAKNETEIAAYQVDKIVEQMNFQSIKIIMGSDDKLNPISEIKSILKPILKKIEISVIDGMDHEPVSEQELIHVQALIKNYFQ